jgi:hypothetical protein
MPQTARRVVANFAPHGSPYGFSYLTGTGERVAVHSHVTASSGSVGCPATSLGVLSSPAVTDILHYVRTHGVFIYIFRADLSVNVGHFCKDHSPTDPLHRGISFLMADFDKHECVLLTSRHCDSLATTSLIVLKVCVRN